MKKLLNNLKRNNYDNNNCKYYYSMAFMDDSIRNKSKEMKEKIVSKVNEGQEKDVAPYTWETIPDSIKQFWFNEFNKMKEEAQRILELYNGDYVGAIRCVNELIRATGAKYWYEVRRELGYEQA